MMDLAKNLAVILGLVVSLGTVFTVTLPGLRNKIKAKWKEGDDLRTEIGYLRGLLEEHVKKDHSKEEEACLQKEVDICVLRDLITTLYYKYSHEKKIPVYAMEDITALYQLYQKRGGNSYVQVLMRQIIEEWEVMH